MPIRQRRRIYAPRLGKLLCGEDGHGAGIVGDLRLDFRVLRVFQTGPLRQIGGVGEVDTQRPEVLRIAGQQDQIMRQGRGGDGDVGEAGVATRRQGLVGQSAGDPGYLSIERQDSIPGTGDDHVEPSGQAIGAIGAAGAAQFADALFDLDDRDGREIQALGAGPQPIRQMSVDHGPVRRQRRQHRGVEEPAGAQRSISRIGVRSRSMSSPPGKDSNRSAKDGRPSG